MLSSDASYTATYNYSDADGNYTGLLQSETKTLPEVENLPLIPDVNIQVTLYTYDANGNQLTVTDYEGNVKNYAYDGLNQLISYSDDENTASYTYRMDGMRRSKTVNGTTITHAGEVRAQIVLALAISNAAMTKKHCSPAVSHSDNMRYSFRVWLLNLGLIGDEYKNCRTHLLKHLTGDIACTARNFLK